jgi:hypothetical protein
MLKRLLVLSTIAWAPPAHAQHAAEAERLFLDARTLLEAGRTAEACELFDASYRLDPNVSTLMNQANCRESNGQLATAWAHYVAVANRTSRADKATLHARSTSQAAALERRLSYLIVNVPDTSRIDGLVVTRDGVVLDPGAWNRSLPVDGGTYVISGKAPGYESWSTTVTIAAESERKSVDVPRFHAMPAQVEPPPPARAENVDMPEDGTPSHATGGGWQRRTAIGLAAGGGVALLGALLLDASARSRYEAAKHEPDRQRRILYETAVARRYGAQVVVGLGAACVATGAVMWLLERRRPPRVVATIGSDGLALSWSGGF